MEGVGQTYVRLIKGGYYKRTCFQSLVLQLYLIMFLQRLYGNKKHCRFFPFAFNQQNHFYLLLTYSNS